MREIKFRGWDEGIKKMLIIDKINLNINEGYGYYCDNDLLCKSKILMQFTGLKDKNGKEIYEGDILQNSEYDGSIDTDYLVGKVIWDEEVAAFMVEYDVMESEGGKVSYQDKLFFEDFGDDIQVIGNIYENPERLE